MAEAAATAPPTLSEQYLLKEKEANADVVSKSVEVEQVENPPTTVSEGVDKTVETPAAAAEETPAAAAEETPASAAEENTEANPATAENNAEDAPAATEESNETTQEENSGEQEPEEEKPEIKLETAPADYRFPTTNQTRHCFTRYIEYHRCVAAKGDGAPECDKYAKYYRSLCPTEWVERWNEQRENGTFPGPL